MILSRQRYGLDTGLQFSARKENHRYPPRSNSLYYPTNLLKLVSGAVSRRVEGIEVTKQPPMSYCKGETCEASYVPLGCNN